MLFPVTKRQLPTSLDSASRAAGPSRTLTSPGVTGIRLGVVGLHIVSDGLPD